jgi:nitronate monooxygenase
MLAGMLLDELGVPIVLAPLGGGPSTPRLTAAVSNAGGLGVLASAYLTAAQTEQRLAETRAATDKPFGVNLFAPVAGPAPWDLYADYVEDLRAWAAARGAEIGEPRFSDDDWNAKIEMLLRAPVPLVTFAFGCPSAQTLGRLREVGSEIWVTVTTPQEAAQAAAAGTDALIVQGSEAGRHRAGFGDGDEPALGLLSLLQLVRAEVKTPLVAAGGIATGAAIAAVLAAGARAAQMGTAFMLATEAGTPDMHRDALRSSTPTELTRAFTGRLARGIRNRFIFEHRDAPDAYPEIHYATAPLRRQARERGEADAVNLWSGETHQLARELPAGEILRQLTAETRDAIASLQAVAQRLGQAPA